MMDSRNTSEGVIDRFVHFRLLKDGTRRQLEKVLHEVNLKRDDVLFRLGTPASGCYLLDHGALKVSMDDPSGREAWLAILGAGDLVGELGVIDRQPRSASVSALTNCRLWRLTMRDFDALAATDTDLYRCVVRVICERLRVTNLQVCSQNMGIEGRLAQTMMKLAKAFGEPLADGRTLVRYRIAQSRLAEIAGVSRENVNRQLRVWREAGLFSMISRYYCLQSLRRWEQLAGSNIATITG